MPNNLAFFQCHETGIYIYSSRTLQLVQHLKALSERRFSGAAFRGKFPLEAKITSSPNKLFTPKPDSLRGIESEAEKNPFVKNQFSEDEEETETGKMAVGKTLSFKNSADSNKMPCDQLRDPLQVPLLAVVGCEAEECGSHPCSGSYLTLWDVSTGSAFLRLKAPALQVMSLSW